MNNKYLPYIILVIIFLIGMGAREYYHRQEIKRYQDNLQVQKDSINTYKLKNGQLVYEKGVLEVTEKELKDQLWVKDDSLKLMVKKYKDVKSTTTLVTITLVDSIEVPIEIPCDKEFNVPFNVYQPFYSFDGYITNNRFQINNLKFDNTQRIVLGTKKGWFNTRTSISITNSNPYIQTTDIIHQEVVTPIKRFGVGPFAGVDFTGKPTVGIGVSYDLLRF